MATEFHLDRRALPLIARSPQVIAALRRRAEDIADAARQAAPIDEGDYRDGIEVDAGLNENGQPVGRVNATDFKSNWIEFGTEDTPKFAPLRRGLDSSGG